jgi:hypothetical protein
METLPEFKRLGNIEFWTSGTDAECEGRFMWCPLNRRFINRNMSWAAGENGDCVSVKFSNGSSTFSKSDCTKRQRYICEVVL